MCQPPMQAQWQCILKQLDIPRFVAGQIALKRLKNLAVFTVLPIFDHHSGQIEQFGGTAQPDQQVAVGEQAGEQVILVLET